ncbi:MAG: hypothetical protein CM15mP130_1220 [Verrucomicrobiota bacterium]|nr:MAG: hypothetical protein CM15mP130_1220 [Verrucomicrobiota bacterium]
MPSTINSNSMMGAILQSAKYGRISDAEIILPKIIRFLSNWQGPFRKIRKEPCKTQDIPFQTFAPFKKADVPQEKISGVSPLSH